MLNLYFLLKVLIVVVNMPASLQSKVSQSLEEMIEGSNKFAVDLYQALKSKPGNIVVCPLSAQIVLTLASRGARGTTAEEMSRVLHLDSNDSVVLEQQKALLTSLESPILKLANRMFIDKTFKVKKEFQAVANKYFLSGLEVSDFSGNPEGARGTINSWVETKTNNLIKDLLPPGVVANDTRCVLVNAIHFKGLWVEKFDPALTSEQPFHVSVAETIPVPMMFLRGQRFKFAISESLDAKLLEMPYEGDQYSMIIILPNKVDGLPEVESKLSTVSLSDEISKMRETTVDVQIPKFKIEAEWKLEDQLQQMGITTAFSDGADFSGLADEGLKIDAVVQKAFIEVNEEGTEAAAATGLIMMRCSLELAEDFFADHPFFYMITSSSPKNSFFMGAFRNPA